MSERLLDVPGVAAYLDVSEKFIRRHALELGAVKVGSHLRFRRADVDRFLDERTLRPARRVARGA